MYCSYLEADGEWPNVEGWSCTNHIPDSESPLLEGRRCVVRVLKLIVNGYLPPTKDMSFPASRRGIFGGDNVKLGKWWVVISLFFMQYSFSRLKCLFFSITADIMLI